MAHLTQAEFRDAINLLAKQHGLQRLRDKLVRLNALVSRRKVASPETLADQLYMLTSGLRKQVPATLAFHGVWNESVNEKLGEEAEKQMEELAKAVNECLTEHDEIRPDKEEEIEGALGAYADAMVERTGREITYLDMLMKAVPPVAKRLRANGLPSAPAKAEKAGDAAADTTGDAGADTETKE